MYCDLVVAEKNKKEILQLAKSLGFGKVYFIKPSDILESVKEARKKEGLVIIKGGNDTINRAAVSCKQVDVLLNPEPLTKDSLTQRNSGLNQVLCKLAAKNNVAIGFSFDRLFLGHEMIGKIMQNIKLCRKYKVNMIFVTLAKDKYQLRSAIDMLSIARLLGMEPGQAKRSLMYLQEVAQKKGL